MQTVLLPRAVAETGGLGQTVSAGINHPGYSSLPTFFVAETGGLGRTVSAGINDPGYRARGLRG